MLKRNNITKKASALILIVGLTIIGYEFFAVKSLFFTPSSAWEPPIVAHAIISGIIVFTTLAVTLLFLGSLWKNESPFNMKNIKYLKLMAILLLVHEPYSFVSSQITQKLYPTVLSSGNTVKYYSFNTALMAAGLVVYCVSLVFQHGLALQEQVDETL